MLPWRDRWNDMATGQQQEGKESPRYFFRSVSDRGVERHRSARPDNSRFPWRNSRKFDRHESFFPRNISHHREQFERRKESGSKRWTNRVRSSRIGSEVVSGGRELNVDDNSGASKQRVGRSVALVLARSTVCGAAHVHSLSLSPSPSSLMEDNDGGRERVANAKLQTKLEMRVAVPDDIITN